MEVLRTHLEGPSWWPNTVVVAVQRVLCPSLPGLPLLQRVLCASLPGLPLLRKPHLPQVPFIMGVAVQRLLRLPLEDLLARRGMLRQDDSRGLGGPE